MESPTSRTLDAARPRAHITHETRHVSLKARVSARVMYAYENDYFGAVFTNDELVVLP